MTSEIPFVGLHAHSVLSVFDALGYPAEHMDFAYENGCDAMAITDHGNMNALSYQVLHAKKMNAEGKTFKPIYGIEAYFLDSIALWALDYAEYQKKNKRKKKEEVGLVIEDEQATKKKEKLTINRRAHLVILAQNETGLKNLFKLISLSYKPGKFYRYPRMDFAMLARYSEGLIVSSACMGGPLAKCYWRNKEKGHDFIQDSMVETIEKFKGIFGDRFYGEVQWNSIPEQHEINQHIIEACGKTDCEIISTADSHYPSPDKWKDRELYKRLGWLGKSKEQQPLPEETLYELYPKNGDQMYESYQRHSEKCGFTYDDDFIKETITRTYDIAHNRIETFYPDDSIKLPSFIVPEGESAIDRLRSFCEQGMKDKGFSNKPKYVSQLEEELSVIDSRNFGEYFLTMKEISDNISSVQLVGAGRGSAAGSLVSYVLGITQVDPLKYGLLFSRFLRKDAKDYPDIDYDCSDPMSAKKHLAELWGENCVVPISNFNTLKLRSLVKDISKFYGINYSEVNRVTSVMNKEATAPAKKDRGISAGAYTPTFEELLKYSSSLRQFLRKYPEVETHIKSLHGQVRSVSRHAGGILVADDLDEKMPLINSGGTQQTPWTEGQNVRHLEPLGFIKFDILGLATLAMIEACVARILKRHHGIKEPTFEDIKEYYMKTLHPDVIDLKDQSVYKNIFHKGKWAGVFQFTEKGAQDFCSRAKPRSINDLSAITAIYRPGPLSANVHEQYIDAKNNVKHVHYINNIVKKETKETLGFLVFQEQIALLAHKLGGLTLDEGNLLRKLLIKKGTGEQAQKKLKLYNKFLDGCEENKMSRDAADKLWKKFEFFNAYGFNKSHAVSYCLLSYQCAWLLNYFQDEWVASFLDKEPESRKEQAINIAKSLGYTILPPNINKSGRDWEIAANRTLLLPLSYIKGLGDKAVAQIEANRPFNTVEELIFNKNIVYSKLNKKCLDVLIRTRAVDELVDDRFTGLKHFWTAVAVDRPKTAKKFAKNIETYAPEGGFTKEELFQYQVSLTGLYPLDSVILPEIRAELKKYCIPPVGSWDEAIGIAWFVPREVVQKKTSNGRDYWIVKVVDETSKQTEIKCWGVNPEKDRIQLDRPYVAKLDHSDVWGFSSRQFTKTWRLLG